MTFAFIGLFLQAAFLCGGQCYELLYSLHTIDGAAHKLSHCSNLYDIENKRKLIVLSFFRLVFGAYLCVSVRVRKFYSNLVCA